MKFDRHIFTLLFAVSMLAATACSKDITILGEEPGGVVSPDDDGMVDVVLNVSLESSLSDAMGTRAGDENSDNLKNIDLFIYVLRDTNNNILWQYGKGFLLGEEWQQDDDESNEDYIKRLKDDFPAFGNYKLADDNNQTLMLTKWEKIVPEDKDDDDDEDESAYVNRYMMTETITLRVLRGTEFKFSCWAQSSQSTAYDFNYLTALKVDYGAMEANSDINDAYCATSIFSIGQFDTSVSITLNRPFAQINIGISEDLLGKVDSKGNPPIPIATSKDDDSYKYSKFKISGLATAFDVVRNKVWNSETIEQYEDGKNNAESDYANYSPNLFTADEIEYIKNNKIQTFDLSYSLLPGLKNDGTDNTLTVFDFSEWGPDSTEGVPKKKYRKLAMAYVLVPDFESVSSGGDGGATTSSITFDTFYIAKDEDGNEDVKTYSPKEKGPDGEEESLSISVKRNWRTNLLFTDWAWANQ